MSTLFDFDRPSGLYAVMGNPVAHSQSPRIHRLFADQFGIRIDYRKIQVDPGGFAQAVSNFQASGGMGLNVTVPFKVEAWELSDRRSPRAELAGAVNTISFDTDGRRIGDNTDGVGIARDIAVNLNRALEGQRVLIVGAGGAVRGVLGELLRMRPAAITIANRTVDRAVELVQRFAGHGPIDGGGFDTLAGRQFDVVINGTAASLQGELPALPDDVFAAGALAYDMMYSSRPTVFMEWAQRRGAVRVADGLGMLVEQAAESFFLWHGKRPRTATVIDAVRSALADPGQR